MHERGFTAGQKTVENQDSGPRAIVGSWLLAAGPLGDLALYNTQGNSVTANEIEACVTGRMRAQWNFRGVKLPGA